MQKKESETITYRYPGTLSGINDAGNADLELKKLIASQLLDVQKSQAKKCNLAISGPACTNSYGKVLKMFILYFRSLRRLDHEIFNSLTNLGKCVLTILSDLDLEEASTLASVYCTVHLYLFFA